MTIKIIEDSSKGYAIAEEEDQEAGRMTYSIASSELIIIDHTEVHPQYQGKAVGRQLLDAIVGMARESHKQIIPLCPFAHAMFQKNIALQDVLKKYNNKQSLFNFNKNNKMENNTQWSIDPMHSEIAFKVKHMMISTLTGHFEDFDASVVTHGDDFKNATIAFSAKIASINTKNTDRDTHLKSDDFFNAEAYPEMKFVSKSYDGEKLVGDLTIRDVTKEITLDTEYNGEAVDSYGQTKAGFEIKGAISRKDFNLTWNAVTEAGSIVVSDKVNLTIDVQFVKQA